MEEIDLKRFIKTVSNLKLIIISIIILAIACGCYYSYCMVVPKYKSSVTVLLTQVEEKKDEITQSDVSLNNNLLTTYTQLIKSKSVLKPVIENLGLDMTEDELEKNITVSTTSNSQTLDIIAYNEDARTAQDIADEISDVFAAKVKEIYKINNVTIIDEAFLPENPYNVNHIKDIIIFIVIGFVASMGLALLIYFVDTSVKDEKDIEEFVGLPVLISLPLSKNKQKKGKDIVAFSDPKSIISESFRTLRTNLTFAQDENSLQNILITSCNPAEGKTYTSSNLAITFAKANKKVIIVDADMRKGRLHGVFGQKNENGLSNYLKYLVSGRINDVKKAGEYIKETAIPNLHIMTSGDRPLNPSELISSPYMLEIIQTLDKIYDVVIIDGTPSAIVSDSIAISKYIKTILVVSEYKKTKIETLKKLKKQIENVNAKVTGTIINKYPVSEKTYGSGYYSDLSGTSRKALKETTIRPKTVSELVEEAELREAEVKEKNSIKLVAEDYDVDYKVTSGERHLDTVSVDEIKNEISMIKNLFLQYMMSNNENKALGSGISERQIEILKEEVEELREFIRLRELEKRTFEQDLRDELLGLRNLQEEIKQIQETNRLKADEFIEKYKAKSKSKAKIDKVDEE